MDDKQLPDYSALTAALKRYADLSKPLLDPAVQEAVKRLGEQLPRYQDLGGYSAFSQRLTEILKSYDLSAMRRASENLSITMREYVALTVSRAKPYMSDEQLEEIEEILPEVSDSPDQPPQKERRPLSISDWIAILSFLVTLIFSIVALLPDAQLEQIAEQNEQIIDQNEQMIEQNDERIALLYQLLETAQDVDDLIGDLSKETDPAVEISHDLSELAEDPAESDEDSDDLSDLDDDPDDCGRLDQLDDAQQDDSSF